VGVLDWQSVRDRDIIKGFYLSQGALAFLCLALLFLFGDGPALARALVVFRPFYLCLSFAVGLAVVAGEWGLERLLPEGWLDDDGINRRVLQAFTTRHLFFAMFVVAAVEETLFRGLLQPHLGLGLSSLLFGLAHVRYWRKPLMLLVAVLLGFCFGELLNVSGGLWAPIAAHYVVDVGLGLLVKRESAKA
jgi:membrane protease YdiL (CAAX protease family)